MKLIRTKLGSFDFWYKKGDKTVGERIALRKYERFETYLMKNLSRKPGAAVDVGANIGYYTLILSKVVKKVIAFEPEPVSLQILAKNVRGNKIKNVQVLPKAASDKSESLRLGLSEENLGDHQINSADNRRKDVAIRSTTLDSEVKDRVSILKIDTQGWEPKVVAGAKKLISRDRPTIFMEFWPEGYKRTGLNYQPMISFLEKMYGSIYLIDDFLGMVYKISPESLESRCRSKKGYIDLLFKKKWTMSDRLTSFRKFRVKKLIKNLLGLETR